MFQRAITTGALMASISVGSSAAADTAQAEALFEALALPDIIEIMREEGIEYGAQIGTDLFPSQVGSSWSAAVHDLRC